MAASILRYKGGSYYPNARIVMTSLWSKGYHMTNPRELHTSQSFQKDRRKDRFIAQHLHYRDHEKSLIHRNLPIVELPDYSYTDGRPTEISICQRSRQERNFQLAKQIVQLVDEMKFAKEQHISQSNNQVSKQIERHESMLKEKNTSI